MRGILFLTALAGAACRGRSGAPAPRAGTISVSFSGTQRGSFTATATGRWCPADTLLEVIAVRGDTSFGFSLIARDSVRAESYFINETQDFTPGRPQSHVAIRMLGQSSLLGFDARSGQVTVTRTGSSVSGTIDARMRRLTSTDSLRLKGTFERIPVALATGACGRANKPGGG